MTAQPGLETPEVARGLVEQHTIGPIPESERNGSAKGLFGIWLGVNMLPLTVVTGALGTTLLGLSFWSALAAMVIGNAVGGVFMALHASQGPTLGVPQMLQARAQFGSKGATLIVVIAAIMFMGFFISNIVVGAQSLNAVFPSISTTVGIVLAVIGSMAITVVGLRLIKLVISVSAVVIGVLVVAALIWIISGGIPEGALSGGTSTAAGFFSMLAIAAVWQIAYAPYVSDYSRYMPAHGGQRAAFWATYGGSVISACLVMALGLLIGAVSTAADAMSGLAETTGGLASTILIAFALASCLGNAGNVYCATLNVLTIIETFRSGWIPAAKGRLTTAGVLHVVGLVAALGASATFLTSFTNFVLVLLYVLIPWSAINLVDYFLVAHGHYDVSDFFRADGGRYGRWNLPALGIYALGVLVQIPFAVLPMYTGPIAEQLHHVDLAWVVGLVVSGGAYLVVARNSHETGTPVTTESGRTSAPIAS
jgi:nucleobase:cation symporter-1, NCS1 family